MNSDRLLVKKVLNGDTQAFEELVISYYPGLYGFLIKMGVSATDAENLAQEVFLKVFQHLYRYDDRWKFSAWFYKKAYRSVRIYKRRNPRPGVDLPDIPQFLLSPEESSDQLGEAYQNALFEPLHDEVRSMYVLHYYNGFTLREVCWIFGLSVSSVRMRMARAREFLVGNVLGMDGTHHGTTDNIISIIKKSIPCGKVPVDSIMSLVKRNTEQVPGFWKRVTSRHNLRRAWPIAVPAFLGIILIAKLCVQDISKPFWGSVMTLFDKEERPVSVEMPPESTALPIAFSTAPDLLSGDDLVAMLNEMDPIHWYVLHASENQITVRNNHTIASCRNGRFYQIADLNSLGLNPVQESAEVEFSFSPSGAFFVVGNIVSGSNSQQGKGVYLINASNGQYYQLSQLSYNQMAHSWSQSGNYLAYADKAQAESVFLLNTQTLQLVEMKIAVPVTDLYVSNNGGVAILSEDMILIASEGDSEWATETVKHEPFYINPDSGTIWYIQNGVIMKHVMGNDQNTAIMPMTGNENPQKTYITDYRIVGNHMVFRMRNGYSGTMNLRTARLSIFNTSREMKAEDLPWCQTTPTGTRVMFVNEGKFLIVSENSVTTPHIPGYSSLTPDLTRWVNEEEIAYIRMINEKEPQAGELSIYTINALTGVVTEIFRSVDKEPVLNEDKPGSSGTIPPVQSTPQETDTLYETNKATGRRVESFVKNSCRVKSGPGDGYADIGEIGQNEIIVYNNKVVNGWCLAQKISGMLNYYDSRNAFWIKEENIHFFDRNNLPAGIITADKVNLSKTSLRKGNLIRIVVRGEQRSYVISETTDTNFGITGWVSNNSFTQDFNDVYFNQAYLKSRSIAYSEPRLDSEPVSEFNDYMTDKGTDIFVNLTGQPENGFVYVTIPGGMSGWVREQDIFLPGKSVSIPADYEELDLDSDGLSEKISFTTDGQRYSITVNGIRYDGHGAGVQPEYKLVDINLVDPYYEIVIEEHGSSNDYMSTFYYYDGKKLIHMGKVEGLCENTNAVKGDGIVRSRSRGNILETWFFINEYQLNSQHKLVQVPSAFYEKLGYKDGPPLRLKIESLPFVISPGSDQISFLLYQNETVRFVGSDNQRWCLFQTDDGRNGWLEISGFWNIAGSRLTAMDVFDGLNIAD